MEIKGAKDYIIIIFLLILAYISFLLIEPFISALITSFILAYLFYPVYTKLNKVIKKEYVSAFFVTLIIVLIFLVPVIFTANILVKEIISVSQKGNLTTQLADITAKYIPYPEVSTYMDVSSSKITSIIQKIASDIILNLPSKLLEILIIIFTTFYLLVYGESFVTTIKKLIPFKKKEELFKHLGDATYSIVYGLFIIAIIEFLLSVAGLTILRIHSPILWSLIIGLAIFIPAFGPLIILSPLMIIQLINKNYYTLAGLLILWAILSGVETFLRPKIIGDRTKTNAIVILIGILGGIKMFGFIGIIAGPLVLSLMIILIQDYYVEYIKD